MAQLAHDPAQLEGEALRNWYQRSASAIQKAKDAAQQASFNSFFEGQRPAAKTSSMPVSSAPPQTRPGATDRFWESPAWQRWQAAQLAALGQLVVASSYGHASVPPFVGAAATVTGADDCISCHGRLPSPLPGQLPGQINLKPIPPSADGGSGKPEAPPQCEVQFENDNAICRTLRTTYAKQACWSSANARHAHCLAHQGEIGKPDLRLG